MSAAARSRNQWFRAFLSAPSGRIALAAVLALLLLALLAPEIWGAAAAKGDMLVAGDGPSRQHLLGTDRLGRDLLLRILVAARLSLGLALAAASLGAILGFSIGAGVSLLGPRARGVGLRAIDTVLGFPAILLAIFVIAIVGPGPEGAVLAIGVASAPEFARLASTLSSSVAGREYVAAARVLGIPPSRVFFRYLVPNIADTLSISVFVSVGTALVAVSSLSFLGLGVQPPLYDWGRMLTEGIQDFYVIPVAALAPAFMIAMTDLSLGFVGEAFARSMNPMLWTEAEREAGGEDRATPGQPLGSGARETGASTRGATVGEACAVASSEAAPLLLVDGLTVKFPTSKGIVTPVGGVSFALAEGECVGIIGESGSGKSMTALAVAQLVPFPGIVRAKRLALRGEDLRSMPPATRRRVLGTQFAMVFQDPMSSLNPALRVGLQLTEASMVHRSLTKRNALELAAERLREVHVQVPESRLGQYPHEFSGGMRQRAMIAMGLMNEPSLIIADEVTTALDVTVQAQVIDVLREANVAHGMAILMISHNVGVIAELCTRVLVMYAGHIVEDVDVVTLLEAPAHPYARALIAAVPDLDADRGADLATIPGRPPDLASLPPGCAFEPRCAGALDRCRQAQPELVAIDGGQHRVACWVAQQRLAEAGVAL